MVEWLMFYFSWKKSVSLQKRLKNTALGDIKGGEKEIAEGIKMLLAELGFKQQKDFQFESRKDKLELFSGAYTLELIA